MDARAVPTSASFADDCDALERRLADAQAALRARDDFLAIAAHELRSPMNALVLQLDMLERMAESVAEGAFAGRVRIVKRTISGFVRRATLLLDVARLNDDKLRLYRQPVDVGTLVDGVVGTYADEARFHGATLRTELEPGLSASWDAQAVDQILSNLVTNAIKYASSDEILVGAAAAGPDAIRLTVADRGVGIPRDCLARIFERFERVVGRPGSTIGFGLGLWIVGGIVRAHGGTIEVETEPGAGTRFHVLLPRGVSSADPPETPSP